MQQEVTTERVLVTNHEVNKIQKEKRNQPVCEGETSANKKLKEEARKKVNPLVTFVKEKVMHHQVLEET